MTKRLLIGTGNDGKFREIVELLSELSLDLVNLSDCKLNEIEETGATYLDNASLKAVAYAKSSKLWTLAEDSGLEVSGLNAAPGVYSARHAGKGASRFERNQKVLSDLSKIPATDRRARFVCVAVLASPNGQVAHSIEGTCLGTIADKARGTHGFGYDSIFIPEGFANTFGELPIAVKQRISHRARAISAMKEFLSRCLGAAEK